MFTGKAKALAQKQHQYQSERLSASAESVVLRAIGSWLMKQIPPLQRANELFSFAEGECMFAFLEELVRMDGLLGHPVLQRERWDSDVYEHLQAETDSLQRCKQWSRPLRRVSALTIPFCAARFPRCCIHRSSQILAAQQLATD